MKKSATVTVIASDGQEFVVKAANIWEPNESLYVNKIGYSYRPGHTTRRATIDAHAPSARVQEALGIASVSTPWVGPV